MEKGYEGVHDQIIKEAKKEGIPFKVIPSEAFLRKFPHLKSHVILETENVVFTDPDLFLKDLSGKRDVVVCAFDGIFDPQNLGNIIRSAACFGIDAIILPRDRSCGITGTVEKIARGGLDHVPIVRVVNLARYMDALKKAGFFCYGLDEKGDSPLWDMDMKGLLCLVFGNEDGLRRLTRDKCDAIVRIPTREEFPSLNVATCFAVSLHEVMRQRAHSDWRGPSSMA